MGGWGPGHLLVGSWQGHQGAVARLHGGWVYIERGERQRGIHPWVGAVLRGGCRTGSAACEAVGRSRGERPRLERLVPCVWRGGCTVPIGAKICNLLSLQKGRVASCTLVCVCGGRCVHCSATQPAPQAKCVMPHCPAPALMDGWVSGWVSWWITRQCGRRPGPLPLPPLPPVPAPQGPCSSQDHRANPSSAAACSGVSRWGEGCPSRAAV